METIRRFVRRLLPRPPWASAPRPATTDPRDREAFERHREQVERRLERIQLEASVIARRPPRGPLSREEAE